MGPRLQTHLAAAMFYFGFRIYGATKAHAWVRTKAVIADACIDKVVELSGIRHPDKRYAGKLQITFEGGPMHGAVRHVDEPCATTTVLCDDGKPMARYRRTARKRGQSVVFEVMA